ncbi:hypothetical protein V1525DRAFT_392603 [Lipomyces kononenkoae]|uniref:Uncharacterized protein n=1 Tax=Lipomyces kononenkoae TaxID=34357 RepID=A0ACC3TBF3_LIPKO
MASPDPSRSNSDETITGHRRRTRLTHEKVMEILGRREVKARRLPTVYDNYRKSIKRIRGEHGHFLPTETGFSKLSKEERDRYEPTHEQLEEAEEILRLEGLKDALYGIMDQLEYKFGVSAFTIASGPVKTRETVYFATPSALPFIEYEYNRMRDRCQDEHSIFYRWNLFLHSKYSFFDNDTNGPLAIDAGPSTATSKAVKVKPDTPVATMRKVVRRLVENVTGQITGKNFSEKSIDQFLHEHGFYLDFSDDWDLARVKKAYETRSHPLCREVIKAVEDGKIRVVRY